MLTTTDSRLRIDQIPKLSSKDRLSCLWAPRIKSTQSTAIPKEEIRQELRQRTDFPARRSQQAVLRAYDKAARMLESQISGAERLIRALVDQSFDMDQCHVDSATRKKIRNAMRDLVGDIYSATFSRPRTVKTLELISGDISDLHSTLHQHQLEAANRHVDELFEITRHMRERGLLGTIRFAGTRELNCEFSYFRSKAFTVTEHREERLIESKLVRWRRDWRENRWNTLSETREVIHSGVAHIQHAWTTHVLSNCQVVPVDGWCLPLPPRVNALVEAIPAYLRPFAQIVHGTFESGRIIEADVEEIPYSYQNRHTHEEEVRHYDPAVVVGDTVLTGWCPLEQPKSRRLRRIAASAMHRLYASREK